MKKIYKKLMVVAIVAGVGSVTGVILPEPVVAGLVGAFI